jgi:hypothetical protein
MIADICLEACPPNTIEDKKNHLCIGMEYTMASEVGMIYIMGFFIVCV